MGRVILLPLVRDPVEAEEQSTEKIRQQFPSWEGRDGDPMTILMRGSAVLYSDLVEAATRVGEEIFRYMGRGIAGLPPTEATVATGSVIVTAVDANGPYLVPEGLEIIGRGPLAEPIGFRITADATIPNGATTVTVAVEATEDGTGSNGITGAAEFDEFVDYLASVEFDGETMGAVDREEDTPYLDRLQDEFQLFTPRPIKPEHFEVLARRLGAYRATVIDGLDPTQAVLATNERQVLSISGATSGNVELHVSADGIAAPTLAGSVAYNASAATIDTLLEAHLTGANSVTVTGGPLNTAPVEIEFTGSLAARNIPDSFAGSGTLAGPWTGYFSTVQQGAAAAPGLTGQPATVAVAMIDEQGDPLGTTLRNAIAAELTAMREVGFRVFGIDPEYTAVEIEYEATTYPGADPLVVKAAADAELVAYVAKARWGILEEAGDQREWLNEPLVRWGEVHAVLQRVEGLRYVDLLEIGEAGGALSAANLTMDGFAPLPTLDEADITGTVTAG